MARKICYVLFTKTMQWTLTHACKLATKCMPKIFHESGTFLHAHFTRSLLCSRTRRGQEIRSLKCAKSDDTFEMLRCREDSALCLVFRTGVQNGTSLATIVSSLWLTSFFCRKSFRLVCVYSHSTDIVKGVQTSRGKARKFSVLTLIPEFDSTTF
jgi:hypothetical protein